MIAERVIAVIEQIKKFPPGSVTLERTFAELGIDSLDTVDIMFELEEVFAVNVDYRADRSLVTVGDAVRLVERYVSAGGADAPAATADGALPPAAPTATAA